MQRQAEEQEQDSGSYITWPSGDRPATPPHLRTDPLPAVLPNEDPAQLMPEVDAEGEVNKGKQPFWLLGSTPALLIVMPCLMYVKLPS